MGLREIGTGENLIFIHGFPTHGYTWRKLIPKLSENFRCYILDLPGLGTSGWSKETDFNSEAQARYVIKLLGKIKVEKYSLIAHNSGATVARSIAIQEQEKVNHLIMFNTEIPNHRPPWIPFYQQIGLFPLVPLIIRMLLKQEWFIKSSMGFKELYTNKLMLSDKSNIFPYLSPVINSKQKALGAFKYLKGIDWKLVDDFEELHSKIKAKTLFLWGEDDKTFPIHLGKEMVAQFTSEIEFITIKNTSLLPHEEKPDEIVKAILEFVKKNAT